MTIPTLAALLASSVLFAPAPGAPGAGDPYFPKAGNGGFDVASYNIALDYRPKGKRVAGTTRITATATRDLSRFNLDFTGNTVRSITVDGKKATFARSGGELTVTPAAALRKGAKFTAAVTYDGSPSTRTDPSLGRNGWIPTKDGAITLSQPVGSATWFPLSDHPSDKALFSYAITVPKGLQVVANGEPAGTTRRSAKTTYRWRSEQPMAGYLAMIAIGRFDVRDGKSPGGVRTITAVDPTLNQNHDAFHRDTAQITDWGTSVFGRYPFGSSGGILDNVNVGYALETQNRPVYPGAADQLLIVHELAHQWFGDSLTVRRWKDIWLNEGFATYAEWLWSERHGGRSAGAIFDAAYKRAASDKAWKIKTGDPGAKNMFGGFPIYTRGAMTLHALRKTVGDATFFALLQEWPRKFAHRNVETADFVRLAEQSSGRDLRKLFDAWLYTGSKPPKP
ncbi:M1 family metallopeptidase [Actinomadura flavalba]|uniref:M1 family metallopeptidase n=1 Tax=Actinomadura flavalba TaxID=1120938 RepID=UPI000399830E|nr:M1 family metallopeptidase [Actinomadura flavalba]